MCVITPDPYVLFPRSNYMGVEALAGHQGWPADLRIRLNQKPMTCKRAGAAERALSKAQYPQLWA